MGKKKLIQEISQQNQGSIEEKKEMQDEKGQNPEGETIEKKTITNSKELLKLEEEKNLQESNSFEIIKNINRSDSSSSKEKPVFKFEKSSGMNRKKKL